MNRSRNAVQLAVDPLPHFMIPRNRTSRKFSIIASNLNPKRYNEGGTGTRVIEIDRTTEKFRPVHGPYG